MEKESRKFFKDVKAILQKLQHWLMVVNVNKENLFKHMKMKRNIQWRVWKLKKRRGKKFPDRLKELVNTEAEDLWSSFKDGILEAWKDLCEKKKQRRK